MKTAPRTSDEQKRQAALDSFEILDTSSEAVYDDITLVAAEICRTPIVLMSLIDKDRQWFKSKIGLDARETPRDWAFCAHTIHSSEPLIVPDATKDERFHDNPLVAGDPNIRFYAGAPLITQDGHAMGTICAIDRKPRELTAGQLRSLEALARQATRLLEFRKVSKNLASAIAEVQSLKNFLPVCAYCRKVKDDEGYWEDLERYLSERAGFELSHGICEDCKAKHFAEYL